ncbi:MAG: hypothetical protein KGQ40_14910, partial [Rhodospirillales bacterium]|nr:hypothetical protein [Rhodospirillales bacterium]
ICARPPEKAAFDVATLKSQLMLAALTCDARDQFNAFVAHYQHDLQGDEKSLNGFFSRAYGRQAQKQHDDFITQLANAQSELGTKAGVNFCKQNLGMFQDVMSLKSDADLPVYAAAKPLQRALAVQECAAAPAPVAKKPVARKIVARKHK